MLLGTSLAQHRTNRGRVNERELQRNERSSISARGNEAFVPPDQPQMTAAESVERERRQEREPVDRILSLFGGVLLGGLRPSNWRPIHTRPHAGIKHQRPHKPFHGPKHKRPHPPPYKPSKPHPPKFHDEHHHFEEIHGDGPHAEDIQHSINEIHDFPHGDDHFSDYEHFKPSPPDLHEVHISEPHISEPPQSFSVHQSGGPSHDPHHSSGPPPNPHHGSGPPKFEDHISHGFNDAPSFFPHGPEHASGVAENNLFRGDVPFKEVVNDNDKIHPGLEPAGVEGLNPELISFISDKTRPYAYQSHF